MATVSIYLQLNDDPSAQVLTCDNGDSFAVVNLGDNVFGLPLFDAKSSDCARKVAAAFIEAADELDRRDAARPVSTDAPTDPVTAPVISDEELF